MKKIICIVFSVLMVLSMTACSGEEDIPANQIINYHITEEPVTLDPQIANDDAARLVITNIFEGLVRLDKDNQVSPGAAEKWTVDENGLVYTFYLRKDLCWSDGTELTANDFVYGIQRAIQPSTGSETADTLFCIKNAEAVHTGEKALSELGVSASGEKTVCVELEYTNADFLELMATPPAMPCNQKYFEESGGQYGRDADKILSNGAFTVKQNGWEHGKYIYLRRNDKYQGENDTIPAGVDITMGESPADVTAAIMDGTIDCYALPTEEAENARQQGLQLTSYADTVWGIAFNVNTDALKYKGIRCALLASLNRSTILDQLPAGSVEARYIIPDNAQFNGGSYRAAFDSNISYITFSSDAKQQMKNSLDAAELQQMPNLNILCTDDDKTQKIVNHIIQSWNALTNTYVNKTPVSRSEVINRVAQGDYNVIIAPLIVDGESPVDTLKLFESSSPYNPSHLNDSTYDAYISDIKSFSDYSALNLMVNAERYLNENAIFYPLYLEKRYYASAANVSGIIFHPYGGEVDFIGATKTQKINSEE